MEERGLVQAQVRCNNFNKCTRPHEARLRVADRPTPLEVAAIEPVIDEAEVLATMIDLQVPPRNRSATLQDGDVLGPPVPHTGQALGQMHGRVGVMADSQQEYEAVELVDAANGAVRPMGKVQGVVGSDVGSSWPTTPRPRQGVTWASNGCSSSSVMLGMTRVPSGPMASSNAPIRPAGPPSTGLTLENAECTNSTAPRKTPRSWSC